jgi:asparagine synthase (glutamine-hydrolysing)
MDRALVHEAVKERASGMVERFLHPWLKNVGRVPPGKLWMVATLTGEMRYNAAFSGLDDPATIIAPLGSQPLVELCLRIATYLSVGEGWRRMVARHAFRSDLPDAVVWRKSKGAYNRWLHEIVRRNIGFIRAFLLDGVLAKERIVDRRNLEAVLAVPHGPRAIEMEIIRHLYTESWLRHWTPLHNRAAA